MGQTDRQTDAGHGVAISIVSESSDGWRRRPSVRDEEANATGPVPRLADTRTALRKRGGTRPAWLRGEDGYWVHGQLWTRPEASDAMVDGLRSPGRRRVHDLAAIACLRL